MSSMTTSFVTAGVSRAAAFAHAHSTSAAKRSNKRTTWPTATKSAYYANFYAVDEATGALIG